MADNKKIRNASPNEYMGIRFKSKLETETYKSLLEHGLDPLYEKETYVLIDGFTPTVPFLTRNKFKKKDYRICTISGGTCVDGRPLSKMTYTPDFTFDYGGKHVIVEVKGAFNDVFPYKFKLFRKRLEERGDKDRFEVWEVHSKKQLLECIDYLKQKIRNDGDKEGTA